LGKAYTYLRMRFLLAALLAVCVLCQKSGNHSAHSATAVASDNASSSSGEAPTPSSSKGGGKKNKKGKNKGKKAPKTAAPAPAPASSSEFSTGSTESVESASLEMSSQPGIPVSVTVVTDTTADTSCANAGVGALWCASKQMCLRAWEQPCPEFGPDTDPVQVKQTTEIKPAGSLVVGTPPQGGLFYPAGAVSASVMYPPATGAPVYPPAFGAPVYPTVQTAPMYPANVAFGTSFAAPVPVYPTAPVYPAAPIYPGAPMTASQVVSAPLIGGQTDNGGCYTGAGYSYCVALRTCVRPWETPCPA